MFETDRPGARITNPSRSSGVVFPRQIDTCSEDLLRDSAEFARERNLPIMTHLSQSVNEFLEMVDRHGMTPVQWAHPNPFAKFAPRTLGHAIFIDEHSWLRWPTLDDLRLLAETGTTVAHCPSPFARYGRHPGGFRAST